MTIASIDTSETKKDTQFHSGVFNVIIAANENRSFIEDLYASYPKYVWGCSINLTMQASEYTEHPRLYEAYVFCDEKNYKKFHGGEKSFSYLHKFSLQEDRTVFPNIVVNKNCYIYVGIRVHAKSRIHISGNFSIRYFYLNISNPAFDNGVALSEDGKVTRSFDRSGHKVIVCMSKETDHPQSTHVVLHFDLHQMLIWLIIFCPVTLTLLLPVCAAILVYICTFCPKSRCAAILVCISTFCPKSRSRSRKGYSELK